MQCFFVIKNDYCRETGLSGKEEMFVCLQPPSKTVLFHNANKTFKTVHYTKNHTARLEQLKMQWIVVI